MDFVKITWIFNQSPIATTLSYYSIRTRHLRVPFIKPTSLLPSTILVLPPTSSLLEIPCLQLNKATPQISSINPQSREQNSMTSSTPLAFTTPLPPHCSRPCAVSAIQHTCPIAPIQRVSAVTALRSSSFLPSFEWCISLNPSTGGPTPKVMCQGHSQKSENEQHEDQPNEFVHKFDPNSDTVCRRSHTFSIIFS